MYYLFDKQFKRLGEFKDIPAVHKKLGKEFPDITKKEINNRVYDGYLCRQAYYISRNFMFHGESPNRRIMETFTNGGVRYY